MKCPFCSADDSKVIDSRPSPESNAIRRRRECVSCLQRFTTYEKIEVLDIMVIKKDNTREAFNRDKIIGGIRRATEKRPVSAQQIDDIASKIEQKIANNMKKEVSSQEVGEMVMAELKDLDEIAYIRFASVYRSFKDVDTFVAELKKMLSEKNN